MAGFIWNCLLVIPYNSLPFFYNSLQFFCNLQLCTLPFIVRRRKNFFDVNNKLPVFKIFASGKEYFFEGTSLIIPPDRIVYVMGRFSGNCYRTKYIKLISVNHKINEKTSRITQSTSRRAKQANAFSFFHYLFLRESGLLNEFDSM